MHARPRATLRSSLAYLLQRYLLRRRQLDVRVHGLQLRVGAADAGGRYLFKRGAYEPEVTHYVRHHAPVRSDGVVLDIGANLGWYSLLLAKRCPAARILAFEPEPQNHALLVHNVARNDCRNVEIQQLAVAEQNGEQLFYPHGAKNLGRHSLLPINELPPIRVRTVRLDDHLAALGVAPHDVDFVKIDIEGYELPALRSAPRLLAARPVILAEFAPKYMKLGGLEPQDYVRLLVDAGFQPHAIDGDQLRAVEPAGLGATDERLDLVWQKP